MLPEIEQRVNFLKQVQIFYDLNDDELARVADRLKQAHYPPGTVVFEEGDEGDNLYIVLVGKVRLTRWNEDTETDVEIAILDMWDVFGEDSLYTQKPRSATVTAFSDTDLFYLDEEDFSWLRDNYPQVDPYLLSFSQTHELARRFNVAWLGQGEYIHLITRRHPIRLIGEIFGIFLAILLILAGLSVVTLAMGGLNPFVIALWGIGGVFALFGLIATLYAWIEWRNDFFYVTNVRVVWRERILFRSTSRNETPLRTIQSLNIKTGSFIGRMLGVGDLIVRTFNSELYMTDVYEPERMKDLIEGFIIRSKRRSKRTELAAIRMTIRDRLGIEGEEIMSEEPTSVPPVPGKKYSRLAVFKTRIVDGNTITYRKHWSIFFKNSLLPNILFFSSLVLISGLAVYFGMNDIAAGVAILGLTGLAVFVFFMWWLYEYEDWRNDLYRLTKDTIIDRDKKPFGKESFRSAPIKNIQSLGHEVPNLIGLILNVGNVHINVGDETFEFTGVHDPSVVHQDISQRMEQIIIQDADERRKEEYENMATWLEIYHDETREQRFPWRITDEPESNES